MIRECSQSGSRIIESHDAYGFGWDFIKDVRGVGGDDEARTAIGVAQSVFERVSIDLIYARQDQALAAWRDELLRALDFGTSHLSLYQLTVEDGTVFGQMHAKNLLRGALPATF